MAVQFPPAPTFKTYFYFSMIQEKRNLKPNLFLAATVSHLFVMCSGEAPGFIPARDNSAAPISGLQQTFIEDYRLKKYFPVIVHPHHFSLQEKISVYYSFEIPTTIQFSPKSNNALTSIAEARETKYLTDVLLKEIRVGNLGIEKTPLFNLVKQMEINFYHSEKDSMNEILPASYLALEDKSLTSTLIKTAASTFPEFSPFFRACIGITAVVKE